METKTDNPEEGYNAEKGYGVIKPTVKPPPILSEALKIQNALESIGYEVCGYLKKHHTNRIVIYLTRIRSYDG